MSNSSSSSSSGISVIGLLGVVFVTLKLTGYIDWSWWWVTAPFWGSFALALAILLVGGVVLFANKIMKDRKAKYEKLPINGGNST
jgi:hypothetical protein